jgi:hypothetical protein
MIRSRSIYERKVARTGIGKTEQKLVSFPIHDVREWILWRKGNLCGNVGEAVVVEDVVHDV